MTTPIDPCALCGNKAKRDILETDAWCPNEDCENHHDGYGRPFSTEAWLERQRLIKAENRIRELTEQRDHWRNESIKADGTIALMHAGITDLEAKLNVAMEAMDDCYSECCDGYSVMNIVTRARAALKEIER